MPKANPHDALFKATMSHPSEVEALVRGFLPSIVVDRLDLSTLTLEKYLTL
ncbi:MAG: Rpn family recombination-promoting nuclease/putative transposase [Saprospiraceae bacterium]